MMVPLTLFAPLTVPLNFDNKSVFIHVSKEPYENGEERGVYIHLGGAINQAFYLAGRNSIPEKGNYVDKPENPYTSANKEHANRYKGDGSLKVAFTQQITTEDGKSPVQSPNEPQNILQQGDAYTLLPCDNTITLGSPEIASLVKPLFYQDNTHTLFIEPNVTERTIEEWQEWVTRTPQPEQEWDHPDWWEKFVMIPEIPREKLPIDPRPLDWCSPESLINIKTEKDWLINPGTCFLFEEALIAPGGRAQVAVLPPDEAVDAIARGGQSVNVNAGSGIAPRITVIAVEKDALDRAGLVVAAGGLNVVGSSGFNSALAQNFDVLNRSVLGTGNLGIGR